MRAIGWWGVASVVRGKKDSEGDKNRKVTNPAKLGVEKKTFFSQWCSGWPPGHPQGVLIMTNPDCVDKYRYEK